MWRYLSLPTCLLSLWLASAPADAAGSDGNARTVTGKEWSRAMKSSFFVAPPARLPSLRQLAQASSGESDASRAIPPEAVKAEAEKRWDDAERAYRAELAKEPNRVDLLLRLVDVLAAAGKKLEAAQTLARAADLRRSDFELQLHASEGFAAVERPADALRYVDRALALRPDDLDVHRRRARLSAWAGDTRRRSRASER